jgi:hypothetical protein
VDSYNLDADNQYPNYSIGFTNCSQIESKYQLELTDLGVGRPVLVSSRNIKIDEETSSSNYVAFFGDKFYGGYSIYDEKNVRVQKGDFDKIVSIVKQIEKGRLPKMTTRERDIFPIYFPHQSDLEAVFSVCDDEQYIVLENERGDLRFLYELGDVSLISGSIWYSD